MNESSQSTRSKMKSGATSRSWSSMSLQSGSFTPASSSGSIPNFNFKIPLETEDRVTSPPVERWFEWAVRNGYTSGAGLLSVTIFLCWGISFLVDSRYILLTLIAIGLWAVSVTLVIDPGLILVAKQRFHDLAGPVVNGISTQIILVSFGMAWGWFIHSHGLKDMLNWGSFFLVTLVMVMKATPQQKPLPEVQPNLQHLYKRLALLEARQEKMQQIALAENHKKNMSLAELKSLNLSLSDQIVALSAKLNHAANAQGKSSLVPRLVRRVFATIIAIYNIFVFIVNSPAYAAQAVRDRLFLKVLEYWLQKNKVDG